MNLPPLGRESFLGNHQKTREIRMTKVERQLCESQGVQCVRFKDLFVGCQSQG